MSAPSYLVGLDLGQANDFSAWIVAQRVPGPETAALASYDVPHVDRVRGAAYPVIVDHTRELVTALRAQDPKPAVTLAVDFTGVGRPVADMLVDAKLDCTLQLVTITGGEQVTRGDRGEYRVPKRDLASAVQVLLQSSRLRIDQGLPLAQTLVNELINFRVKISLAGHDSYGAGEDWRVGNHDDLVLALALAVWFGERNKPPPIVSPHVIPYPAGAPGRLGMRRPEPMRPPESFGRGWRP